MDKTFLIISIACISWFIIMIFLDRKFHKNLDKEYNEKLETIKNKYGDNHSVCCICGAHMHNRRDYVQNYEENNLSNICFNCYYFISWYNGIATYPLTQGFAYEVSTIHDTFGCYSSHFQDKEEKIKTLYKLKYIQSNPHTNNFEWRFKDYGKAFYMNTILDSILYDGVIHKINKNKNKEFPYISHYEVKKLLDNSFNLDNGFDCYYCKEHFNTYQEFTKIRENEISKKKSSEFEKFKVEYQLDLIEKNYRYSPVYLIDRKSGKLQTYCSSCAKENYAQMDVSILEPLAYYDNINQIKALL